MTEPLVCIAVPCYNQQDVIGEALESIVTQDYPNIRVVVSDDASRDATPDIIRDFERRYPGKLVVQCHEKNLGVTGNVRSMLPLFAGEYLCWFAGDDVFLPGKLRKQVALMEANPHAVMSYHDIEVFDGNTGRTQYRYNERGPGQKPFAGKIAAELIARRCFIGGVSVMVRRSAVGDLLHRPELPRVSDWLYFIEVAHRGEVLYLPEPLARYRRHMANVSKVVDDRDEIESYRLMERLYPEYAPAIEKGRAGLDLSYAVQFLLKGDWRGAAGRAASLGRRLAERPGLAPFVGRLLGESVLQRVHLLARTGRTAR